MPALTLERRDRVGVVTLDVPDKAVNTLSLAVGREWTALLDQLASDAGIDAVVLRSGKAEGFIAGADIEAFTGLQTAADAEQLSREGQGLVDRTAAFAKPLVMAIHGACLGGGLELALAADYRIVTDAPATRLGLPEVQLGLIPGMTGCQRLPRLVGLRAALDMILTGRTVTPSKARRTGLVHEVVAEAGLGDIAVTMATRLAGGWRPPKRRAGLMSSFLDSNPGRWLVFRSAARRVAETTGGHYPAPTTAIDVIRTGLSRGAAAGREHEAVEFGRLAVTSVSRNLVRIFFATTSLKKDSGVATPAGDLPSVDRIGVVGAGFMGAGIAGVAALKGGVDVRLKDTDWERIARGITGARRIVDSALSRRRIDRYEHARRRALISGAPNASGFGRRDLVIEAVFEDLEVKRTVIAELEGLVPPDCIVASNTSTLPIAELQRGSAKPDRIIGMHFFSPVDRMPLLEVIRGPETSDRTTAIVVRFGKRLGKTTIVVRDQPGFWVNRILAPYLNEAGWLLHEGASVDAIDRAMTDFGFPVGPIALLDEVGLDVARKASGVLAEAFGSRFAPAPAVSALVEAGRLGRKSGSGFYRYDGEKRVGADADALRFVSTGRKEGAEAPSATDIGRRPLVMMLNEAARGLADDVVRNVRDADIGAVFGFGFPPFLGGPLAHIDTIGARALVDELQGYAARLGPRFEPAPSLLEMARASTTYYDAAAGAPPGERP